MNCIKIDINICRVCLQSTTGSSIFGDDILEKFRFTTLVHIQQNDGMPELLCKKCHARLRVAYDFKKQVQESDHHLRTFISDVNQKFQQVTGVDPKKEIVDDELQIDSELLVFDEIGDGCEIINDETLNNPIDILDHQTINASNENVDILADDDTADDNYGDGPEQMEVLIINEDGVDMSAYTVEKLDDEDEQPCYGQNDDSLNQELNDAEQMFEEEEHLDDTNYEPDAAEISQSSDIKTTSKKTKSSSKKSSAGRKKSHFCIKCNKEFSTGTNLTRHMVSHDGNKPYVCTICGNAFTQNGSLKSHMFIHTGERPFACKVCPKAFTQSKSLTFHMRRHTGEKPYQCKQCGMQFRQKDGLKRHENAKHTDKAVTPYPCEVCGKILQSKYSLKFHMSKHTTKREPLKCDLCSKILYSEKALGTHKMRHHEHEQDGFKCGTCGVQTQSKSALYTHQIMDHQLYPPEEITFTCPECDVEFDSLDQLEEHSKKFGHSFNHAENEFDF